ncbi:hypothetical protein HLB42_20790 (plasmid) [Deinococcus sp. D7000]|nr:hypothetical protein HLB42_20790 [Deinococcus sp. D7000]
MKHPDGQPMTPAAWTVERLWRWERLNRQQRSSHPIAQRFLPLFERYAEGELGNMAELIDAMERHQARCRTPRDLDSPAGSELEAPAPPATSAVTEDKDGLTQANPLSHERT